MSDVVIVGAGPSGLACALVLARYGLRSTLLERSTAPTPENESRALTIMPAGMRFLRWLGLEEPIAVRARLRRYHDFFDGHRRLMTIDFDTVDSPFRRVHDIPQPVVERILEAACIDTGLVDLRRGEAVVTVGETGRGVYADTAGGARIEGSVGVGCDGFHSAVRAALGITTTRRDYGASSLVADFRTRTPLPADRSRIVLDPGRPYGYFPFGKDRFRLVLRVNEGERREQVLDAAFLEQQVRERIGPLEGLELLWASQFRLAQLQSRRYESGRWVLCGDAAHAMGPSAGSGMQLGLLGAWRLGWRLAHGLGSQALLPALLADYGREHRVTADAVQRENAIIFRNLALASRPLGALRALALRAAAAVFALPARMGAEATLESGELDTRPAADYPRRAGLAAQGTYGPWRRGVRVPTAHLSLLPGASSAAGRRHLLVALTSAAVDTPQESAPAPLPFTAVPTTHPVADSRPIYAWVRPDATVVEVVAASAPR